jgi:hypothetical protein
LARFGRLKPPLMIGKRETDLAFLFIFLPKGELRKTNAVLMSSQKRSLRFRQFRIGWHP